MPRKQVLGRKHKSGTGNNKDVPSTRIISKAKVTTTLELPSVKTLTKQIIREVERDELRKAELHELFKPQVCFACQVGACDREECEEESDFGCMSSFLCGCATGVYEVTPKDYDRRGNVFLRFTRSQRIAYMRRYSSPRAEAGFLNDSLRSCWLHRRARQQAKARQETEDWGRFLRATAAEVRADPTLWKFEEERRAFWAARVAEWERDSADVAACSEGCVGSTHDACVCD